MFIFVTAVFIVAFDVSPSRAGLALSNAFQLYLLVSWLIRTSAEMHQCMASVSSIVYFDEHVPQEVKDDGKHNSPPPNWPSEGEVSLSTLNVRLNLKMLY